LALELFKNNQWIKRIHEETTPAYTYLDKLENLKFSVLSGNKHCCKCLTLNGCYFPKTNMPRYPLHPNYHCRIEPISNIDLKAECDISKFRGL
jgi:hypothetical protein